MSNMFASADEIYGSYWIFNNEFKLLCINDNSFLDFLLEMISPMTRDDENEILNLVNFFNKELKNVGLIFKRKDISNMFSYKCVYIKEFDSFNTSKSFEIANLLNSDWLRKKTKIIEENIDDNPFLVVGLCRDLIEGSCKAILKNLEIKYDNNLSLSKLTKNVYNELDFFPSNISNHEKGNVSIKKFISGLDSIVSSVSELRNLYGSGHGRDNEYIGLESIHARFIFGMTVSYIEFLISGYKKHSKIKE